MNIKIDKLVKFALANESKIRLAFEDAKAVGEEAADRIGAIMEDLKNDLESEGVWEDSTDKVKEPVLIDGLTANEVYERLRKEDSAYENEAIKKYLLANPEFLKNAYRIIVKKK